MVNSLMISMSLADLETRFEGHDRCMGFLTDFEWKKRSCWSAGLWTCRSNGQWKKGGDRYNKRYHHESNEFLQQFQYFENAN